MSDTKRPILVLLTSHWVSLLGVGLVTTAGFSWFFVLPIQMRGHTSNPYIGIVVFIFIPVIFVLGLVLIALGALLARRRIELIGKDLLKRPDRQASIQRLAMFLSATTAINIVIGTQGTYRAVEHMETVQFCGQSCHVMKPEFATHENSPHSNVACVECHVSPGAAGWVEGKKAGTRQLVETVLNTHPRPIPSAMESNRLVPSRDTCEQCHWPAKFDEVKLRVIFHFQDDAANTQTQTVLMMLIGGGDFGGIHGKHMGAGVEIRYAAQDAKRRTIPWVEYRDLTNRENKTFLADNSTLQSVASLPRYSMQCVDCHNRPTHRFELPERAVDRAMGLGLISPSLPFIKRKAVELLKANYASNAEASRAIPEALNRFYQQGDPSLVILRSKDILEAGQQITAIFNRNVFPDLGVTWGTYPDNLGHTDSPGCFRCHDGSHSTTDHASTIPQDCSTCHEPLAIEEAKPGVLKTLGLEERITHVQKP